MKDEILDKTFRFPCDRWLAKNDDDGQIMRELACANNDYLDLNEKTSKAGVFCVADFKVSLAVIAVVNAGDPCSCHGNKREHSPPKSGHRQ